jgi:hypothetical protein
MPLTKQEMFQRMYECTQHINSEIKLLKKDMDGNDTESIVRLEALISERGKVIEQLSPILKNEFQEWTTREQLQIKQMKEWETSFQPKLTSLYESFSEQFNKLKKGKRVTKFYNRQYDSLYTDGAYFDKRK